MTAVKLEPDPATAERLLGLPWFSACGQSCDIPGTMAVKSAAEAKKAIASSRWENLVLDHRGDFTEALCLYSIRTGGGEDRQWNPLSIGFKERYLPALTERWKEALDSLGLAEKAVLDDLCFNILAIATIDAYKGILETPPFFRQLLAIYGQGHLACGWKGKKDKGSFFVY